MAGKAARNAQDATDGRRRVKGRGRAMNVIQVKATRVENAPRPYTDLMVLCGTKGGDMADWRCVHLAFDDDCKPEQLAKSLRELADKVDRMRHVAPDGSERG